MSLKILNKHYFKTLITVIKTQQLIAIQGIHLEVKKLINRQRQKGNFMGNTKIGVSQKVEGKNKK